MTTTEPPALTAEQILALLPPGQVDRLRAKAAKAQAKADLDRAKARYGRLPLQQEMHNALTRLLDRWQHTTHTFPPLTARAHTQEECDEERAVANLRRSVHDLLDQAYSHERAIA